MKKGSILRQGKKKTAQSTVFALQVSPKGEELDLEMLFILQVFVRLKCVNVSESALERNMWGVLSKF